MNKWMNEWIKEWMNEWMDEWIDGWKDECLPGSALYTVYDWLCIVVGHLV